MSTGMHHLHMNLAHLLVLTALIGMILSVLGAASKPSLAMLMAKNHKFGVLMLGRLIYAAGFGVAITGGHSFAHPWMIAGILFWGGVEVAGKRLIGPELQAVIDGDSASSKLMIGAAVQLVIIVTVYGLMQIKPVL
jgi:hypothetical protein